MATNQEKKYLERHRWEYEEAKKRIDETKMKTTTVLKIKIRNSQLQKEKNMVI